METLWSRIIWDELGMKDYKIHEHKPHEVTKLVLDWAKKTSKENIIRVLGEISFPIKKDIDYYDGPFHMIGEEGGTASALMIHDSQLEAFVIGLFLVFPGLIDDIPMIKELAEKFQARKGDDMP